MYKQLIRDKVRFQCTKGNLTLEQLWDLTPDELNSLAVALDAEYEASGKKSFIVAKSVKDKATKAKFDAVIDILNTKMEEAEKAKRRKQIREKNKKIIDLIAEKQEDALKGKSIKALEAMLEDEE